MSAYEKLISEVLQLMWSYAKVFHEYINRFAREFGYNNVLGKISFGFDIYYFIIELPQGIVRTAKSLENYDTGFDFTADDDLNYIAGWKFVLKSLSSDKKLKFHDLLVWGLLNMCTQRNSYKECRDKMGKTIIELIKEGKVDFESMSELERILNLDLHGILDEFRKTLEELVNDL